MCRTIVKGKTILTLETDDDCEYTFPCDRDLLSVAAPGHTLRGMVCDTTKLKKAIRQNKKPKAILLSGGGNDILEHLPKILNHRNVDVKPINASAARKFIGRLKKDYLKWLRFVTKRCGKAYQSKVPILIHGYAYAVPSNQPILGAGSWLYKEFRKKGHTDLQSNTIAVANLIDRFNDMLSSLHKKKDLGHVKYVDLRKLLTNSICCHEDPNYNYDEKDCLGEFEFDWNDEFHPTGRGFRKIAKEFSKKIKKLPKKAKRIAAPPPQGTAPHAAGR